MGKESWQIKLKSDIREYVALKIRERRNEAGMTQGELGVQCNLTRASIANIEKAGQMPPLDILYTIALALDCSPLDLLPPESITSEAMRERLEREMQRIQQRIADLNGKRSEGQS